MDKIIIPKKYKVLKLNKAQSMEKDFDLEYHEKYIGLIGVKIEHNHMSDIYKNFVLLKFSEFDLDWFHIEDLKEINNEKCSNWEEI